MNVKTAKMLVGYLDIERQVSGMEQGVVLGRVLREGVWSDAKQNRKQGGEQLTSGSTGEDVGHSAVSPEFHAPRIKRNRWKERYVSFYSLHIIFIPILDGVYRS